MKTPLPPGNGCDQTLDHWFTEAASLEWDKIAAENAIKKKEAQERCTKGLPPLMPTLPEACEAVLKES